MPGIPGVYVSGGGVAWAWVVVDPRIAWRISPGKPNPAGGASPYNGANGGADDGDGTGKIVPAGNGGIISRRTSTPPALWTFRVRFGPERDFRVAFRPRRAFRDFGAFAPRPKTIGLSRGTQ